MRLTHGHTFLGGLVAGVALDVHALWLYAGGVATGIIVVLVWGRLAGLVRWARRLLVERGPLGPGPFRSW